MSNQWCSGRSHDLHCITRLWDHDQYILVCQKLLSVKRFVSGLFVDYCKLIFINHLHTCIVNTLYIVLFRVSLPTVLSKGACDILTMSLLLILVYFSMYWGLPITIISADLRYAPSQWETSLQSNAVSHWLGANLEPALVIKQNWAFFLMQYGLVMPYGDINMG